LVKVRAQDGGGAGRRRRVDDPPPATDSPDGLATRTTSGSGKAERVETLWSLPEVKATEIVGPEIFSGYVNQITPISIALTRAAAIR
jgi:hypothetical protein